MKTGFVCVGLMALVLAGCAKHSDEGNDALLSFRVESRSAPSLVSGSFAALSLPSSVDGFSCFIANVMGSGIPARGSDTVPTETVERIIAGESDCSYTGVTSVPISTSQNQTVTLRVPKGLDRWVEIVGVKDAVGNICSSTSSASVTGDPLNDFIYLGGVGIDLFGDRSVEIDNVYSSSNPISVDCGTRSYSSEVSADSPKFYFRMNESAASSFSDQVGTATSGTVYSTPTTLRASGPLAADLDGAMEFDGTTPAFIGYLSSFDVASGTFSSGITLEAWISSTDSTSRTVFVAHGQSTNPSISLVANASAQLSASLYQTAPSVSLAYTFSASNTSLAFDGDWHHVVVTLTSSLGTLYVDGEQLETVAPTGSGSLGNLVFSSANPTCWSFAADTNTGTCTSAMGSTMNTSLAEIALYPAVLSTSRVRAHYRARNFW